VRPLLTRARPRAGACWPAADPVLPARDSVASRPGGRAITAAIAGRLVGFIADLGVGEKLLDAVRLEQPEGRIFAVLPGAHPSNRVARAAGWHEVLRSRTGTQLLVHPDHPALASILLRA